MAHFTTSNTEGFNTNELDVLNAAFDRLSDEGISNDMGRVDDAITNAWSTGMTADELISAVKERIVA